MRIVHDNYGKSRVRLLKVERKGDFHSIQETTVKIALEGDFDEIHTVGDNSLCLPTDTMKNTVYALAHQTAEIEEIETFAKRLTEHFLANNQQITRVVIEIVEHGWTRLGDSEPHPHSFIKGSNEQRTTKVNATRDDVAIESGVLDLIVLKTTKSGFVGYLKDQYTTLPETSDRVFATSIKANWRYENAVAATGEIWRNIRQSIIETFAAHDSLSVQHTLYAMGKTVLQNFPDITEISFSLPNIHYLPVDVSRFGLENDNRIFLPTDEPHGLIEAHLAR
ncbi:MAG TPA: urate oxidase [Pyrinomonadaceae bacterium]|nr:urate oxidase [Pyrinomonadaceae bacterium]